MLDGAKATISLVKRYFIPGNMVVPLFDKQQYIINFIKNKNKELPPLKTIFPYKSFLISESHFMIDQKANSCKPYNSFPSLLKRITSHLPGKNKASGHLNA